MGRAIVSQCTKYEVSRFTRYKDLLLQKTGVPGLACGVVCVILRLAVLVELRLVTDRRTDTGPWLVPRMHSIAR